MINFIPGIGFFTIHKSLYVEIIKHALGIKTEVMEDCIPEDKIKDCINSSRIFVLLWFTIITVSIYFFTLLPIFLFLIPRACLIISIYNDLCIVKNPIPGIKFIKKLKSVCLEKILPSAS